MPECGAHMAKLHPTLGTPAHVLGVFGGDVLGSNDRGGPVIVFEVLVYYQATLAEVPGQLVSVAPHEVHADLDRRLWYCDIELAPGPSYFPFVRLALARYQPNSMAGVELSRIVLADFAQLTPDQKNPVGH